MQHITQKSNKEFDLPYPIEKIKQTIFSTFRLSGYRLDSKNDLLNIYKFVIVKGFHTGIATATLKKLAMIVQTVNLKLLIAPEAGYQLILLMLYY